MKRKPVRVLLVLAVALTAPYENQSFADLADNQSVTEITLYAKTQLYSTPGF